MNAEFKKGFSLTEVLMAVGILSVGMMLIATMFPVGIYLTTVASERTMAAIVADEAFAKIQLYGFENPSDTNLYKFCLDYEYAHNEYPVAFPSLKKIDPNEFSYPSVDPAAGNKQYYWSALCKKSNTDPASNDTEYLVTVFVARKTSPNLTYWYYGSSSSDRPRPIPVQVHDGNNPGEMKIEALQAEEKKRAVNPPTTILDNASGRLYRVVDRQDATVVKLDRNWDKDTNPPADIWLIPPPLTGGRNADIEVYQRIMRF